MHLRKILALAELHGVDAVARALDDGLELQAFSPSTSPISWPHDGVSTTNRRPCNLPGVLICWIWSYPNRIYPSMTVTKELTMPKRLDQAHPDADALCSHLSALKLPFMLENHQTMAKTAAEKHWSHWTTYRSCSAARRLGLKTAACSAALLRRASRAQDAGSV